MFVQPSYLLHEGLYSLLNRPPCPLSLRAWLNDLDFFALFVKLSIYFDGFSNPRSFPLAIRMKANLQWSILFKKNHAIVGKDEIATWNIVCNS